MPTSKEQSAWLEKFFGKIIEAHQVNLTAVDKIAAGEIFHESVLHADEHYDEATSEKEITYIRQSLESLLRFVSTKLTPEEINRLKTDHETFGLHNL